MKCVSSADHSTCSTSLSTIMSHILLQSTCCILLIFPNFALQLFPLLEHFTVEEVFFFFNIYIFSKYCTKTRMHSKNGCFLNSECKGFFSLSRVGITFLNSKCLSAQSLQKCSKIECVKLSDLWCLAGGVEGGK